MSLGVRFQQEGKINFISPSLCNSDFPRTNTWNLCEALEIKIFYILEETGEERETQKGDRGRGRRRGRDPRLGGPAEGRIEELPPGWGSAQGSPGASGSRRQGSPLPPRRRRNPPPGALGAGLLRKRAAPSRGGGKPDPPERAIEGETPAPGPAAGQPGGEGRPGKGRHPRGGARWGQRWGAGRGAGRSTDAQRSLTPGAAPEERSCPGH